MPRRVKTDRTVSASEAAKNFGALVDRVREERAEYIIERAGRSPGSARSQSSAARCGSWSTGSPLANR